MNLEVEEYDCDECNGRGFIRSRSKRCRTRKPDKVRTCEKCRGFKKLDWIEMITGKQSGWNWIPENTYGYSKGEMFVLVAKGRNKKSGEIKWKVEWTKDRKIKKVLG